MVKRTTGPAPTTDVEVTANSSLAPAVTRAAAILDALAGDPSDGLGLSEIARRLDLPKSSVANICSALLEVGFIARTGAGFRIGRRLAELGGAYLATVDQVQEFHAACDQLEVASLETMQLAVLDGLEVIYIARHDGRQAVRLASEIGQRLPASCTALGKAALAALDEDELGRRLKGLTRLPVLTSNSHRTVDQLLTDLAAVRQRGYSIDNEETALGVVCYGVAVQGRGVDQEPHAASVTLLKARADDARRAALVNELRRLAELMTNPLQVGKRAGGPDRRSVKRDRGRSARSVDSR
jgi:DNA-binding IclR family transcriptional regulator